jgi:uncharacterized protein (DUF952 family)
VNFKHIYKIIDKTEWQQAKDKGSYLGSSKDTKDGYIHFSDLEQVKGTLKKFFINKKNLILLKVDTLNLNHLIWEQASDGTMFPHLYSPLDTSNVVDEFDIILDDEGNHVLPSIFN